MKSFKAVLNLIRHHDKFLVSTHQNPDADAIASALSVSLFLKALGKKTSVIIEDVCPAWLKFLPATSSLKKVADIKKCDYDVAIIVDCGDLKRIGRVSQVVNNKKPIINIDHHITNDHFGKVNVVWPKASSTCEMIFCLLKEARHPLNQPLAELLYAGIMTDTGSFRHENTTELSHHIAAYLLSFKVSVTGMYDRLYVGIPVDNLKLFTNVIHDARLLYDRKVYCLTLPKTQESRFAKSFDLKEKLFTFLRSVEGIEVIVIITQLGPRESRVNMRSRGKINVAAICQKFNGGGHRKAAGCKMDHPLPVTQRIICEAIRKQL